MNRPKRATEQNLDIVFRELRKIWEREAEFISLTVDWLNKEYWSLRKRLMARDSDKQYWGGLYLWVRSVPTRNPHLPSYHLYWKKGKKRLNAAPTDGKKKRSFPVTHHIPIGSDKHNAHYSKSALNKALKGCPRWEKELTHRFERHAKVLRKTFHRQHEVADRLLAYPVAIEELPSLDTIKVENELAAFILNPVSTE